MKSTKVQSLQCNKGSTVVEKNCLVAEYRIPYRIGPCTCACVPLIGPRNVVNDLPRGLSQASCVIVSEFRAALDLDAYPLSNLVFPLCTERAKPG